MEKEGQYVYYTIADERFVQGARLIRDALADVVRRKATQVLEPTNAE
jgi:DNA-binding transcriptional ArsR family regulator